VEYSATKAALNNLSRALAMELAPSGVRVNTVSPGPVRTDMQVGPGGIAERVAAASGSTIDEYVSDLEKAAPLGRFADPRDVAAVVVMTLSDRFGYVTGADLHVDGVFPSARDRGRPRRLRSCGRSP
jgi:NAD(P)-dependent dehydrogenase (short-subunit alcohol dehydrogenase family)